MGNRYRELYGLTIGRDRERDLVGHRFGNVPVGGECGSRSGLALNKSWHTHPRRPGMRQAAQIHEGKGFGCTLPL